jgi:hypothetical protein
MKIKELLRSKTFWAGIGSIASGIITIVEGETQAGVQLIVTGFTAIFLRDAIAKKG